jgi:hypothetical protein
MDNKQTSGGGLEVHCRFASVTFGAASSKFAYDRYRCLGEIRRKEHLIILYRTAGTAHHSYPRPSHNGGPLFAGAHFD